MEELAATLASARRTLDDVDDDAITAGTVIGMLEDAGAQLGRLQVACCAPDRMKLYFVRPRRPREDPATHHAVVRS
jgi:hypothetical protein